jgi:hypothetical protein
MVLFLEYEASSAIKCQYERQQHTTLNLLEASVAMRSKMSFTKEFKMAIALLEIPVSG